MIPTIALLTDFGTADTYVGVMKAVMARICPGVQFIDLTHEIAPQNVTQAAFALLKTYAYFAPGTVFLIVVDPGVGSQRRAVAARAGAYTFIAPDNGVLSHVLSELGDAQMVNLTNPAFQLTPVSNTFHGRDIFAPAAAHLAAGVPLEQFGSPVTNPFKFSLPEYQLDDNQVTGQVLYTDHFGNIITNIGKLQWTDENHLSLLNGNDNELSISPRTVITSVGEQQFTTIRRYYGEVEPGETLVIADSSGYLEISVNGGSAAKRLNVEPGAIVTVQLGK